MAPCGALALACGLSVAAYAVDVVAGSPLTAFSVLGPNPGAGVRFFGIGNELEAILTTLTLVGTGAWLEDRGPPSPRAPRLVRRRRARSPPPRSPPAASAPTSARRSCSGWAPRPRSCWRCDWSGAGRSRSSLGGGWAGAARADRGGPRARRRPPEPLGARRRRGRRRARRPRPAGDADGSHVHPPRISRAAGGHRRPVDRSRDQAPPGTGLVRGSLGRRSGFLGALAGVLVGTVANDSGSVLLVIGTVYLGDLCRVLLGFRGRRSRVSQRVPSTGAHRASSRLTRGPIRGA